MKELRYREALQHFNYAKTLIPRNLKTPFIDWKVSLCHYFLGNLDEAVRIAEEGMNEWPDLPNFRNNYAFARARSMLRDFGGVFWQDEMSASVIFEDFLKSILDIGAFDVAHFNYALLLYWAAKQGKTELPRKILERYGRADLVEAQEPGIIVKAFKRAKTAFMNEYDYFHAAMAQYFADRVVANDTRNVKAKLTDEFVWDADNFFSFRYEVNRWRHSLLKKDRNIKGPFEFPHIVTLKRWMREAQPIKGDIIQDGGGYFLKWNNKGVVLNPGAGFINNFQRRGYSINEINAIIVTSSNYQAYEEFTKLLDLVDKAYYHRPSYEKVSVFLEKRLFYRFPDIHLRSVSSIIGPQVLTPNQNTVICDGDIELRTIIPCDKCSKRGPKAFEDYPPSSVFVFLDLKENGTVKRTVGVICDFCDSSEALPCIPDFDILIIALGPIPPEILFRGNISETLKNDLTQLFSDDPLYKASFTGRDVGGYIERLKVPEETSEKVTYCEKRRFQPFVGIDGLLKISEYHNKKGGLVIIGDIPIDLGDKRHKIAAVLNKKGVNGLRYLTEDLGLIIHLENLGVMCEFEHVFYPATDIDEECLEGDITGPVKHFYRSHRVDDDFADFLRRFF